MLRDRTLFTVPRDECCNSRPTLVGPVAIDPAGNAFVPIVYRSTFSLGTGQAQIVGLTKAQVASTTPVTARYPIHNVDIGDSPTAMQLVADGSKLCVDHALADGFAPMAGPRVECTRYRVEGAGPVPVGRSFQLVRKAPTRDPRSALLRDAQGRVWIGFADRAGETEPPVVRVFFVLAAR